MWLESRVELLPTPQFPLPTEVPKIAPTKENINLNLKTKSVGLLEKSLQCSIFITLSTMPTLSMVGVHPEVCARLVTRAKVTALSSLQQQQQLNSSTKFEDKFHRPTPQDVLICPLDALYWIESDDSDPANHHKKRYVPISLARAARLKREMTVALRKYRRANPVPFDDGDDYTSRNKQQTNDTNHFQHHVALHPRAIPICPSLDKLLKSCTEETCLENSNDTLPASVSSSMTASSSIGGIPFGRVTTITGPPSSGKSQLAYTILSTASNVSRSWLLTNTPIHAAQRLAELVNSSSKTRTSTSSTLPSSPSHQQSASRILQRTNVLHWDMDYQLLATLSQIEQQLYRARQKDKQEEASQPPASEQPHYDSSSLLLIDSLSSWMFDPSLFSRIQQRLRFLALVYGVAVVVVLRNASIKHPPSTKKQSSHQPTNNNNTRNHQSHYNFTLADIQLDVQRLPTRQDDALVVPTNQKTNVLVQEDFVVRVLAVETTIVTNKKKGQQQQQHDTSTNTTSNTPLTTTTVDEAFESHKRNTIDMDQESSKSNPATVPTTIHTRAKNFSPKSCLLKITAAGIEDFS